MPDENDPKTLACLESTGDSEQGLAVLRDLYLQGNKGHPYEKLSFITLPYLHPVTQRLRKGSVSVEEWFSDVSGWRVRIVNLGSALRKLIPLLEQRLAQSRFVGWQGELLIDAGEQRVMLQIDCGKVTLAAGELTVENTLIGGAAVARLLIGSDEPDEIIRQEDMICTGLTAQLARVFFPNLHPVLSDWDGY